MTEVIKENNSNLFLLPAIRLNIPLLKDNGLENVYLGDHKYEIIHENCLYLLFSPKEFNENFEAFCESLRKVGSFVDEYDVEGNKVMFVFKFPDKLKDTLQSFKNGEYSKFDKEYIKEGFPPINPVTKLPSKIHQILIKHPKMKEELMEKYNVDAEVLTEFWSKPNPADEIYNYNEEFFKEHKW